MSIYHIIKCVEIYGIICKNAARCAIECEKEGLDYWNKNADKILKLIKEELEYIILEYQTQINERD